MKVEVQGTKAFLGINSQTINMTLEPRMCQACLLLIRTETVHKGKLSVPCCASVLVHSLRSGICKNPLSNMACQLSFNNCVGQLGGSSKVSAVDHC